MQSNRTMKQLFIFLILLLGFGFGTFAQNKKPVTTVKKVVTKKTVTTQSAKPSSLTNGMALYQTKCLSCHQADGGGVPNLNPPLIQTKWVLGSKTNLVQLILNGSKGKVDIDGETFHNTMPSQAVLTDQQIADVLTYVRKSFGNKASSVSAAEVKAVRAKTKK